MIREPGFSINRKDIFERLFSDYYGILVCYAQKYTKREDIAEDIVQDVFASLWEENRIFPSQANFRSFLYISIRNAAFDYLRHQNVESRYIEEALTANRFLSDDSFQKEEVFRLLFKQIDLLPERCREIFLLHLEGYDNDAIAKKLSLSIETVKTQKKRAMKTLRNNLKEKLQKKYPDTSFFILFLYLDLSKEEDQILKKWLQEDESHLRFFQKINLDKTAVEDYRQYHRFDAKSDEAFRKVWTSLHKGTRRISTQRKIGFFSRRWLKIACALLILLFSVGGGLYFYYEASRITPGESKAILTLEDGSAKQLKKSGQEHWIYIGDTPIAREYDGMIVYHIPETSKVEISQQNNFIRWNKGTFEFFIRVEISG